ncbi:ABC transporter permease [Trinickia mobilis]|uniref:ABC transporter permease n=1 Tax=Trinickia mobilis TaxID=2816356 RepID=UPI001F5E064A|nr:ABC transporter permease [Trinickia mobilis]
MNYPHAHIRSLPPDGTDAALGRRPRIEIARLRDLALVPALVLLIVIGAFVSPSFLTKANLISVLGASAALALVVLAESLIVLTGKFDLSLESTVGIAPAIGAMLVMPATSAGFGWEWPTFAGLLAILAVGALIGFINGFLVVRLQLNAFIVTLAMLIVLRGMLVGATKGGTLFDMPSAFFSLATTIVLGLPVSVWLAAAAFAIAAFMLRYHRLGRALYAIGGNPQAARAAGIRVERITWGVFVLGSVLAALGGLIVTGYVGAINANQGNGMIFTVFAAAVIGGISLDGGKGTMLGALTGVLLLGIVQNLLTLAQVPSFWIQAIYGAIILGSLMVARIAGGAGQN